MTTNGKFDRIKHKLHSLPDILITIDLALIYLPKVTVVTLRFVLSIFQRLRYDIHAAKQVQFAIKRSFAYLALLAPY